MFYKTNFANLSADIDEITMRIEAKYNDFVIGFIKANVNSEKNCIECDTVVDEQYRGMGVATSLLKEMLNKVFVGKYLDGMCEKFAKGTETQKIVLNIDMENFASRRVAEKMGFENYGASTHDSLEYVMTKQRYFSLLRSRKKQATQQENGKE